VACYGDSFTFSATVLQRTMSKSPPHLLQVPKGNSEGDSGLVNDLVRALVPAFLYIAQYRYSQCITWSCDWNDPGHKRTTSFVGYPKGQCPITMVNCALNSYCKKGNWVHEAKRNGYESLEKYQPKREPETAADVQNALYYAGSRYCKCACYG
jgi:hypothetical protein